MRFVVAGTGGSGAADVSSVGTADQHAPDSADWRLGCSMREYSGSRITISKSPGRGDVGSMLRSRVERSAWEHNS